MWRQTAAVIKHLLLQSSSESGGHNYTHLDNSHNHIANGPLDIEESCFQGNLEKMGKYWQGKDCITLTSRRYDYILISLPRDSLAQFRGETLKTKIAQLLVRIIQIIYFIIEHLIQELKNQGIWELQQPNRWNTQSSIQSRYVRLLKKLEEQTIK